MSNYPANGWQDFSLKKDIEKLLKFIKGKEVTSLVVLIDISILFLGLIFDKWFDIIPEQYQKFYFLGLFVLSLIPLVIVIIRSINLCITNKKRKRPPASDLIDMFDNEVCYYSMMSMSFFDLYRQTDEADENKRNFYFIEMCFYRNKTIHILYKMIYDIPKVFSASEELREKKIAISRLWNILNILQDIENLIERNKSCLTNLTNFQTILNTNKWNNDNLNIFTRKIKEKLNIQ